MYSPMESVGLTMEDLLDMTKWKRDIHNHFGEDCLNRDLRKAEEEDKWKSQQQGAMENNNKSSVS